MRGLSTMPARRAGAAPASYGRLRGAAGGGGRQPLRTVTYLPAVTPVLANRGLLTRWRERALGAMPFSREEQFRLLQVGLRIKLRHEGKPEDAIVLQRPDDLPAPPGTPVRMESIRRGRHGGDEQPAGPPAGICR